MTHFSFSYDEAIDQVTKYQRVLLADVTLIELGMFELVPQHLLSMNIFKVSSI